MIDQPAGKLWIRGQEHEDKQAARQRRHAIENNGDLGDLFRKTIIARILLAVAQPFRNHDENGGSENEPGKQNMKLGDDPDCGSISRVRKLHRRRIQPLGIGRPSKHRHKREHS